MRNNKNSNIKSIQPTEAIKDVLKTRRAHPLIFEVRIWTLLNKADFGWGPENITRLALICKN